LTVEIRIGDCLEHLRNMPDESVHCVITSPPYWGLRCYGVDGQLGLEPTLGEHIDRLVEVFREVRRVLRKDGTVWLNYGDCYATSPNGRSAKDTKAAGGDDRTFRDKPFSTVGAVYDPQGGSRGGGFRGNNRHNSKATPGGRIVSGGSLKPKDLAMMPARVALALQADGWWIRSDIIWVKPNPMPESIKDRPTNAHEHIFLLAKSGRTQLWRARDTLEWSYSPDLSEKVTVNGKERNRWQGFDYYYDHEAVKVSASPDTHARYARGRSDDHKWADGGPGNQTIAKSFDHMRKPVSGCPTGDGKHTAIEHNKDQRKRGNPPRHLKYDSNHATLDDFPRDQGRNLRNVWTVATAPFSEAHFATFPPALVEPCIKAGCPEGGTVLDPFGGAGTVGLVADRLGRNAILIELNESYARMAKQRIETDAGMFSQVALAPDGQSQQQPAPPEKAGECRDDSAPLPQGGAGGANA